MACVLLSIFYNMDKAFFIKRNKIIEIYSALCEKVIAP